MRRSIALALAAAAVMLAPRADAVVITYELTDLGTNHFRYDYTVTNDGSITSQLDVFDILFDPALYDEASLDDVSDPALAADWDVIFLASGIGVPAAFDALALGGGLGVGDTAAGFAVEFLWLGAGTPGAQTFEIYDAVDFGLLGTGTTTLADAGPGPGPGPTPIPEPGTAGLLSLALAGLIARRRSKQSRG